MRINSIDRTKIGNPLTRPITRRSLFRMGVGLAQLLSVAGCNLTARDGPATRAIEESAATTAADPADAPLFDYVLLDIDKLAVSVFGTPPAASLFATFGRDKGVAPEIRVGVGDIVQITIFESQSGGLFIPGEAGVRAGNFVTMPPEIIDRRGTVSVPYAGDLPAVGKTIPLLQKAIEKALSNRAIEPQAIVSIVSRASAQASVVGAVNTPAKIEVGLAGDRILDIIAKANGISGPGYESFVTLQRGTRKATVYFDTILANSKENIYVLPGDIVYVYRQPLRYLVFGAVKAPGQIDFGQTELTLAAAVAKASGLADERADPSDVYLYRSTSRKLLEQANISLDNFPKNQESIPTIFRTNFRDPSSYFAATKFHLTNLDVIYVSNSSSYELYKFLTLLNNTSDTIANVTSNIATGKSSIKYLAN